ncbi:DoxX family protein [Erythrobacteraceae bacterium E2-1 Yellow Sea]|nr:DoxX family protein [Erythrobacteraceae bacterium E2-1 Yellow Sea]
MSATIFEKITYWIATLLVLALLLFAAQLYFLNHTAAAGFFELYGYPTYLVYPLATLKLAAVVVILANRWRNLKDIAYGAYFINMIMATVAHLQAGDNPVHAYVGLVAVPLSYILSNRVRGEPTRNAFLLPARA